MSSPGVDSLQSIANDIAIGFEALHAKLNAQKETEKDLRQQLTKAVQRVSLCYPASMCFMMLQSLALELNSEMLWWMILFDV